MNALKLHEMLSENFDEVRVVKDFKNGTSHYFQVELDGILSDQKLRGRWIMSKGQLWLVFEESDNG